MRFLVLGPLEVANAGGTIPLGGPKQRAVLAHLLIRHDGVVSAEALIDQLWGDDPPSSARNTLQTYVSHLRKALGPERIEGRPPGYVLHLAAHELDVAQFEQLIGEARAADGQSDRVSAILREALALWRGPAFADLSAESSLTGEIARLEELCLTALQDRIAADLASGRHGDVIGELEGLTRKHPLRERFWADLMLALYRAGRQADSLAAFRRAQEVLANEIGVDPSPELRRLQERILRQDADLELRGEPLRGYRLLERIGEGAFGVVHRAIQPQIGREVAVKSIHPELAQRPDFVRRFEREAQVVTRLEHPHVVPLYDYWRDPAGAFLVMRFLRGGSLEDLIAAGPLTLERAAAILDQMAGALSVAHGQGVVHRDVKPGNVLLDEAGNAYISDFGVALDAAAPEQAAGAMVRATPAYLSPEQIRLEPATARSDTYSLGVVLFEMLTAEHPFPGTSPTALLERHLHEPMPSARRSRPELPSGIDTVIGRATAKDPAGRFGDPLELAAAFRAVVEGSSGRIIAKREIRNPYKGLRAFLEADAADFFGRDALVRGLVERMAEPEVGGRFLCVVGPSGSGKSSAVRAGLIPALRRGAIEGSDRWYVVEMLPGAHPLRELETALLSVATAPPPSLSDELELDGLGLVRGAERVLPDPSAELVLVVDQLEEAFTLVDDPEERARFLEALVAASTSPTSRVRVVATLRADFFDQPLSVRGLGELLASRTQAITPMSPEELEGAIVGPAERVGLEVEPGFVATMVADVVDRAGALPLLQYALTELADQAERSAISVEAYRSIGGVSGALARRAEQLYGSLDGPGREACRQLFLRLVTLGEGAEDMRRRVRRSNLPHLEGATDGVIEAFGRHRLLSFDRDAFSREPTVEIAHEALIEAWGQLRTWIDDARDDLRIRHSLAASAAEWESSGRDESFLLRGVRLDQIDQWTQATTVALSEADEAYVRASIERRDEDRAAEQARRARERALEHRLVRRLRGLVAVLTVAALVAAGLTRIASNQRGRAETIARIATARELAQAAMANVGVDDDRSVLLALQAVQTTYQVDGTVEPQAEEALHAALQAHRLLFSVPGDGRVDFSPDGTRLLAGDGGGILHMYDAATGSALFTVQDPGADPTSGWPDLAFSPDGSAFASSFGTVWDSATGEQVQQVRRLSAGSGSFSVAFSPDGRFIAAQPDGGGTAVWDLRTGGLVNRFDAIGSLWFSPDGRRLLIADNYSAPDPKLGQIAGYIVDWHRQGGGSRWVTLLGHQEPTTRDGAWSPDGSMVATAAFPEVLVWDPTTAERKYSLTASSRFASVAFSQDSSEIATGMRDGTAIVWKLDVDGAHQMFTVAGHDSDVTGVAFSPDGRRLATASGDGTVKVWDITPEGGHEWVSVPGAQGLAYSPDGRILATTSTTEVVTQPWLTGPAYVHLWDAETGRPIQTFRGHQDEIIWLDFHPGGARVASASLDGTARIWNVGRQAPPIILDDRFPAQAPRFVVVATFSPDGDTIATSRSYGGYIRLWNAETGKPLSTMRDASGDPVPGNWDVDFSADGKLLAAPSDGNVFVWNEATREVEADLKVPDVGSVAFTPNGRSLVASGFDGRLRVWSARTWKEEDTANAGSGQVQVSPVGNRLAILSEGTVRLWQLHPLRAGPVIASGLNGYTGPQSLAFSPDGTRLAAAVGGVVRVYALDIDDLIRLARERVTRGFTEQECRQYLHLDRCP